VARVEVGEDQLRVDHLVQEDVSDLARAGRKGLGGERDPRQAA
jgi:hypothetical protein